MATKKKVKRTPGSVYIRTISHCKECGEPVSVTTKGTAYRHGLKRFRKEMSKKRGKQWSQEDGQACAGSGKPVKYKKAKDQK